MNPQELIEFDENVPIEVIYLKKVLIYIEKRSNSLEVKTFLWGSQAVPTRDRKPETGEIFTREIFTRFAVGGAPTYTHTCEMNTSEI